MSLSTVTGVTMIDTRAGTGAMTLPLTTDVPYRVITVKDIYGALALSSITLVTQGSDVFESGLSTMTLTNVYETTTLYAGQSGYWYIIGGSRMAGASIGTLSTGVIQNPLRIGTLSSLNTIQFPGIASNYTGTIIAEQTTGVGTQELLLFKASSISDQIRLQTTGNIVFEAGASGRTWPNAPALATPTLYIAGTTSNIGIGTATPQTTLDVVGTTRSQTLSSFTLTVSSINGTAPWQPSFLLSTVQGLGTASYISSSQLFSTVASLTSNISTMIDTTELTSTVVGLGTFGFISTVGLTYAIASTAQGLGTFGYTSTNQLLSTTIGIYAAITTGINVAVQPQFISTVQGLGTAGYISSSQLTSTVQGLGSGFTGSTTYLSAAVINVSTLNTYYLSTTFAYISSLQVGTLNVGGASGYVNIQDLIVSTVSAGQITASQSFFSSLQVNTISFGTGSNVILPNILATSVSTIQVNTNSAYVNNLYIGNNSTQSALLFPGINNSYKNSAVAEQNTGVGTQELLFFRGSSISDQIRLQTTGNIVFETGVSARTWSTNTMAATPTLYIQGTTSNIGIGTNAPGATLDVVGTARATTLSTLALNISSINGITLASLVTGGGASQPSITSTIIGLGTFGYVSTSQLISTTAGLSLTLQSISTSSALAASQYVIQGSLNTNQTITSGSDNILGFATTGAANNNCNFDPQGWWNPTLSTMTPTLAGYYLTTLTVWWTTAPGNAQTNIQIRKNGNQEAIYQGPGMTYSGTGQSQTITTLIPMNGTSDNISFSAYTGNAGANSVQTNGTFFNSILVLTGNINYSAGFVSTSYLTTTLTSTLAGLGNAGYVSSSQLISTVTGLGTGGAGQPSITSTITGLGTFGYISSSQLTSTVASLTSNISSMIDPTELTSTIVGLGTFGFISTIGLTYAIASTAQGLGTLGYTSTSQLLSTTVGVYEAITTSINTAVEPEFISTVKGLGSSGYISTSQLTSTVTGIATGSIEQPYLTSTVIGLGSLGYISSSQLQNYFSSFSTSLAVNFITSSLTASSISALDGFVSSLTVNSLTFGNNTGYISFGDIVPTSVSTLILYTGQEYATSIVASSIQTGSLYLSTDRLFMSSGSLSLNGSTILYQTSLQSTVLGLGTLGYISSSQLQSTVSGVGSITQSYLTSTTTGLGTIGYISSSQLTSTVAGLTSNISSMIDTTELTSTIVGLGTFGFISTFGLTYAIASTAQGLGTFGYTSTSQLLSTTVGVYAAITTSINTAVEPGFISTVAGLGTAGYISSSQLTSTVQGLGTGGASQPSITSTITGLGTFGYISSSQLTSTVASFNTLISNTGGGGISLYNLTSTVTGLTSVFRVNVFDI